MKLSFIKEWFKKGRHLLLVISISLIVLLLVLDIVTKNIAYNNLYGAGVVTAIPYLFNFVLVFNNGAAWNILSGQEWLLCLISAVLGTAILVFLYWKFKKLSTTFVIALTLMVAGAYGNLIDRVGQALDLGIYSNGVIDFLQFAFWTSFPVFNLADCYLVIGIFILLIALIVKVVQDYKLEKKTTIEEIQANDDLVKKLKENEIYDSLTSDLDASDDKQSSDNEEGESKDE